MKKTLALVLALLMVFTLFAACGKKSDGTVKPTDTGIVTEPGTTTEGPFYPSDDATLILAFNAEPAGMTQPGHSYASTMNPSYIFGETLIYWDSDINDIVPKLATSWEWVDDLTLRLTLRDDVTSINGDPFTASDVVYTFNLNNKTPALAAYYSLFDYENTKVVDDYTVDIALKKAYPFLINDLAHNAYIMCVEASVEAIGFDKTIDDPSAQTGPYKLTKWETGQCVYAERRDDYWGQLPYYKNIEIWTVTDGTTRAMGVEAGDYNLAFNPAVSAVLNAEGSDVLKAWQTPAPGRYANFVFNSDREPLNVKEVRQAMALAINYDAVLQIAYGGAGELADTSCFSPYNQMAYTEASAGIENCMLATDVEAAKAKLAAAGYADGFTINCVYRPNDPQTDSSATLLQNQLGAIGITLELRPMENAAFFTEVRSGNWDTHLSVAGNPNPKRAMSQFDPRIDHNAASGSAGQNWYPDNDYLTALVDKCLFTVDDTARMAAFTEFNDICREYAPAVILYCPYASNLTSSDIYHLGLDTMGTVNFLTLYPAEYVGK